MLVLPLLPEVHIFRVGQRAVGHVNLHGIINQFDILQGDDLTERFFRNLTELAVIHCLNSERPVPATGQAGAAQPQPQLNFVATDALVRLVVCLVTGTCVHHPKLHLSHY